MLKYVLIGLFLGGSLSVRPQSVAGINFRHLYDPQNEVDLAMKVVKGNGRLTVYYKLLQNGTDAADHYTITWQRTDSYTSRDMTVLAAGDSVALSGTLSYPVPAKPWLLVAKVSGKSGSRSWT